MNDEREKLQHELKAAQRARAEVESRCARNDAKYQAATKEFEETRKKIEQVHHEWMDALDAVEDLIFLHDKEFRILRCNKAYQQCAGMSFKQIIGQPYYAVFPKTGAPLPSCQRTMEKEEEEEMMADGAIYRSRAISVKDEQGVYLYSVHTIEDITEKKQAENKLRLFRQLLDHSRDGISIVDPDTSRFLDVNEALCNHLGYTRDELLQRGVLDIQTDIPDVAAWQAHQQEIRKQGAALMEVESLHKDGSRSPVEVSIQYVAIENHDFIIAVVRDITERKQAEAALQESEEKLRGIFNGALDGILLADAEAKRFTGANPAICHMLGYSSEEIMQIGVADIHPQQALPYVEEQFEKQLRGEMQLAADIPVKRKDGSIFYVDIKSSPVSFAGRNYLLGIFRDITERKQAEKVLRENEEKNRLLFESSRDALMMLAPPSWKFIGANRATLQLFGASSLAEFTALGPWDVSPERQPDGRTSSEKVPEMIATAMREGSHFFEWEHQRLGGQPFAADVLLTRMEVGGEIIVQATVRDISARKQSEAKLVEQLHELRRWHEATSGREERILSIKHEVNELLAKAGQPPRYPSAELSNQEK